MTRKKGALRTLRTIDDVCKILSGRRLNRLVTNAVNYFGEDILSQMLSYFKFEEERPVPAPDDPYFILGVHPEAPDFLVKAAYRAMMRAYHPDVKTGDDALAKKINKAYQEICQQRRGQNGEKNTQSSAQNGRPPA